MVASLIVSDSARAALTRAQRVKFQGSIIDKRRTLHPRFNKIHRKKTRYIIVHTSEAGLRSTLHSVSAGKRMRKGRRTHGGHTHYVIARNGRTYRILDKKYVANHAGRSMWNGETGLSAVSISIELVGYHYTPITKQQYRSIGVLLDILQDVYGLDDRAVLTHSQIAYGTPNRWVKKNHRGRKKCAKNFDRAKAVLGPTWPYDPDTRAGRLRPDLKLAAIFYTPRRDDTLLVGSNVITPSNTAWSIAGEDYDDHTTRYRLPNGREIPGDQIEHGIGWHRIPSKTMVLLNQEESPQAGENRGPVKIISDGLTAWSFAGPAFNDKTTYYFFPDGRLKNGREISDWDDLPSNTKIIVGYRRPLEVTTERPSIQIAGKRYNHKETLYFFPDRALVSGARIKSFSSLPRGVVVFLPMKRSG
ncbi:MAG: N-acetylmuramoyl-L-alanine amidase [candidate division NC10 bacterium RBG_16_65_8]|nr:MAG: N-acetylmuramoyl-L-alanine amidase [candidate division NC10 bacterium RBG_16_65_8]